MSPIKRVRLSLVQKKKLSEDSLKPDFDAVQAAKDLGIAKSTVYQILKQKDKILQSVNQAKILQEMNCI